MRTTIQEVKIKILEAEGFQITLREALGAIRLESRTKCALVEQSGTAYVWPK